MKFLFDNSLAGGRADSFSETEISQRIYMLLWYAHLYTVVEGWKRENFADPQVTEFLRKRSFVEKLRRCRNAVNHYESGQKYWHEDIIAFLTREAVVSWVRGLHKAFSRWFLKSYL